MVVVAAPKVLFIQGKQQSGSVSVVLPPASPERLTADLPPRKRQRLTHLSPEEKALRRKLKNRVAAQTARDRKKARMGELEQQVVELEMENQKLVMENKCLLEKARGLVTENQALRQRLGLDALEMEDKSKVLIEFRTDEVGQAAGSAESAALSLRVPLQQVQAQMPLGLTSTAWILLALTLQTLSLISYWGFWMDWTPTSSSTIRNLHPSACKKNSTERNRIPYQPPLLLLWGPHQPSWKPLMN
ncbi:X-box-binding protein 1 isoform X1 [Microcaecilia unicolor]|uniref:X-box-binding protein 1 n=1 Tax=Microcaecilia unicolor TaxID=1415580 RepID=A0A6P7Z2X2_9AMPH|nr:X-box-binding protein 1 isoform X1 [Microcaecilia unicolor]